jgi:hypothetical protein
MRPAKVLIAQLAATGDCLFVTTIAKQIKEYDFPGCHLTWLIGSKYSMVLNNNHYIDEIIEVPLNDSSQIFVERNKLIDHIALLNINQIFDNVFITDFAEFNYENWFGTLRSALFRNYPYKLKIPPDPIIYLTDVETTRVNTFCFKHDISKSTFNILFECGPLSGQSNIDLSIAKTIAEKLVDSVENIKVILSSHQSFVTKKTDVVDASVLTWRENAELANYCDLVVGCSSGISWLCTSNWTKPVQMIQCVDPDYMQGKLSASMRDDFRYFGKDTTNLIELHNPSNYILEKCIMLTYQKRFQFARRKYGSKSDDIFRNAQFLKDARLPWLEKKYLWVRFHFLNSFITACRRLKPAWFTPQVWLKKL